MGACLDGSVMRWTAQMSNKGEKVTLNDQNAYHSIDFSHDGRRYCLAGQLTQIEFYDVETDKLLQMLDFKKNKCHANKVFSAKYSPLHPNTVYSGSWDCNVKVWDLRAARVTHNIYGTQTCGDSIDMDADGRTLLTGGGSSGEGL